MTIRTLFALAVLCCCAPARSQDAGPALSTAHDGRWSVDLTCDDTQDRNGLVKGYRFVFPVVISGGRLEGRHGAVGAPSSVAYSGSVREDGTLEITAAGNSGRSEYTVGKVAQGSAYGYTMKGRMDATGGRAERQELRRCTATLNRL